MRRLTDRPRKANAWSGKQQTSLTAPIKKIVGYLPMSVFSMLGFVFGCFAFSYAATVDKKYKQLEQRLKKLEDKN